MNYVNTLTNLIQKRLSTQLMFANGSMLLRFQPHDIIARGNSQSEVVVVRGIVCLDGQEPHDRVIPIRDIGGAASEKPPQLFTVDPDFYRRNPVHKGWVVIFSVAQVANATATT